MLNFGFVVFRRLFIIFIRKIYKSVYGFVRDVRYIYFYINFLIFKLVFRKYNISLSRLC